MTPRLYRVVGLEVSKEEQGFSWRAWIVVGGKNTPVKGSVSVIGDLDAQLKGHIREVYKRITGLVLPEGAL